MLSGNAEQGYGALLCKVVAGVAEVTAGCKYQRMSILLERNLSISRKHLWTGVSERACWAQEKGWQYCASKQGINKVDKL